MTGLSAGGKDIDLGVYRSKVHSVKNQGNGNI
jgi:hypothetical protein